MNFLESLWSAEFIRSFALALFHSLWQGALIALIAAFSMVFLRNHRPALRYAVLYLLLMLLPVFFITTFLLNYNQQNTGIDQGFYAIEQHSLQAFQAESGLFSSQATGTGTAWYNEFRQFLENNARWFVLFWLSGFIIFLIRFFGSLLYINRLKTTNVYPVSWQWKEKISHLSARIGLKCTVRLAESAIARIPMTIGYLKPVILLPVGTLSGVPPQQIDAILLHELAHILRKDYLLNIIQSVIELLLFYHPLTWWLSGLIRQEREHICDDLAVEVNQDHINYIKALTTMEELNLKSPHLATAITGSRKKLLFRVKRLLTPVKLRKSLSEGIIALLLLLGLIFALSLNALSVIPTSFDLKGRESGEKIYNILPFDPDAMINAGYDLSYGQPEKTIAAKNSAPDTIISTSKSGKVVVKVYTDSIDDADERELEIFVETIDDQVREHDHARKEYEKQVIILKSNQVQLDGIRKIVVIKTGDSIRVIKGDSVIFLQGSVDTSFSTQGDYYFYEYDFPEMPEIPEIPDLEYLYHDDDHLQWAEDHLLISPPDTPPNFQWTPQPPEPPVRNSERIIRQELRDDALITKGKKYIVELDAKAMYINGEKQPKETYRKYRKLVESLEQKTFEGDETFKMIF
jgi:beta-lactamase regulating signal transducer with metallopeptidase domain